MPTTWWARSTDTPDYDLSLQTVGPTTFDSVLDGQPLWLDPATETFDPTYYLNFIRNPYQPFQEDSTLYVSNYSAFANTGAGATWTPMDTPTTGQFIPPGSNDEISGTGYQIAVAEVDPTTGLTRLIVGNLTGIYSGLDNNGVFETSIGSSNADALGQSQRQPGSRPVLLRCGPAEPAAAQVAGALFYGGAQNIGGQASDPNLLTNGNITWTALGTNYQNPFGPSVATSVHPPGGQQAAANSSSPPARP